MLATVPAFPELQPDVVRKGFFERADVDAVLAELPSYLRPVVMFAYLTGWRRGEILELTWAHVDELGETIRLEGHETKSGEPRAFPYGLFPALKVLIQQQRDYTRTVERKLGRIVPHLFHREGNPIQPFNKTWRRAVNRAAFEKRDGMTLLVRPNLVGRLMHDFRRTCARNMRRMGLSESDIMELCGWETRSMFKRYAIRDEATLAKRVGQYAASTPAFGGEQAPQEAVPDSNPPRKVVGG
jgi:integrase